MWLYDVDSNSVKGIMHREGWVCINGIPTHVQTWGGWITDVLPGDTILLCISGHPGVTHFYEQFLSTLQPIISMPAWIINHAGLEIPPKHLNMTLPTLTENPYAFALCGQVSHQKAFIDQFVPPGKKLIIIGHSVGGKICVELMKENSIAMSIQRAYLIFPTLEHIADAPFGRIFTARTIKYVPYFFKIDFIFCIVPTCLKYWIIRSLFYLRGLRKVEDFFMKGVMKVLNLKALRYNFFLAKDEMKSILDLDHEIFIKYGNKFHCFYRPDDHWAPLRFLDNLKRSHPHVKTSVLDTTHRHAFIFSTSVEMANLIGNEINKDLSAQNLT